MDVMSPFLVGDNPPDTVVVLPVYREVEEVALSVGMYTFLQADDPLALKVALLIIVDGAPDAQHDTPTLVAVKTLLAIKADDHGREFQELRMWRGVLHGLRWCMYAKSFPLSKGKRSSQLLALSMLQSWETRTWHPRLVVFQDCDTRVSPSTLKDMRDYMIQEAERPQGVRAISVCLYPVGTNRSLCEMSGNLMEMTNILQRQVYAAFGASDILSGPFVMMCYTSLTSVLDEYGACLPLDTLTRVSMSLGEDTWLTWIMMRRGFRVEQTTYAAEWRLPDRLFDLMLQRRRWINTHMMVSVNATVDPARWLWIRLGSLNFRQFSFWCAYLAITAVPNMTVLAHAMSLYTAVSRVTPSETQIYVNAASAAGWVLIAIMVVFSANKTPARIGTGWCRMFLVLSMVITYLPVLFLVMMDHTNPASSCVRHITTMLSCIYVLSCIVTSFIIHRMRYSTTHMMEGMVAMAVQGGLRLHLACYALGNTDSLSWGMRETDDVRETPSPRPKQVTSIVEHLGLRLYPVTQTRTEASEVTRTQLRYRKWGVVVCMILSNFVLFLGMRWTTVTIWPIRGLCATSFDVPLGSVFSAYHILIMVPVLAVGGCRHLWLSVRQSHHLLPSGWWPPRVGHDWRVYAKSNIPTSHRIRILGFLRLAGAIHIAGSHYLDMTGGFAQVRVGMDPVPAPLMFMAQAGMWLPWFLVAGGYFQEARAKGVSASRWYANTLYWPYLAVCATGWWSAETGFVDYWKILVQTLLLTSWHPAWPETFPSLPLWFLCNTIVYTSVAPAVSRVLTHLSVRTLWCALFAMTVLWPVCVALICPMMLGIPPTFLHHGPASGWKGFAQYHPLAYWPLYLAGMVLARLEVRTTWRHPWHMLALSLLAWGCVVCMFPFTRPTQELIQVWTRCGLFASLHCLQLCLCCQISRSDRWHQWYTLDGYCSKIAVTLYLCHPLAIEMVLKI